MSMSARQLFLANLASRRFDESDSDGDGSSANDDDDDDGSDASSGDGDDANIYEQNDDISLADQLLKVTPPRNDAVVSALFRAKSHSSLLRKQINCVNINSAETNKSTPTPTEAQVEHKPTMTMAVIPQVPSSPLLRRAESFRRKASDRQNNKVDTNNNNHPIRHVRSFSHDTNARRMVHLHRPSIHELDSKLLSNSLSMSSSFTDLNDDISAVTSVISTASIKSLHSRTTTTTTTTTAPQKQMANNIVQSRREHLPRRPSTMGAGAATSKSFVKSRPADIHNMDDTSTVATEAITSFSGSLSLSHSKSFESSTSKGSSSTRSKELERLKRLSIGGIKRSNSVCDAKDEIIGGYEVQVNMARSDDVSENVSEGSSSVLTSRGREQLHRMKKSTQTNNNPPNSDTKALKQGWKSLNDMKSKRYGGNESVSSSSEHERSTSDAKIASSVMKQSSSMPPYQSVSSSSRTELRRSRSITRSTDAIPPSSSSTRASSTPRMVPTTSPVRRGGVSSQENSMSRTPPRSTLRSSSALRSKIAVAGRTTAQEAPPGTNLLSSSNPTAPLSPLMKSSHKYRRNSGHVSTPHDVGARQQRSPSPVLRTGGSFGGGGGQQPHSPKRESIFQVLKPSKLASLSIAVLNKAVMPIQSLARVYIAKLRIENRKKNIVVMQSLIRRWHCRRYYKSVKTIALYFQGAFRGMVTRDQLDFRHYCASRIQAAFRGYLGMCSS